MGDDDNILLVEQSKLRETEYFLTKSLHNLSAVLTSLYYVRFLLSLNL